MLDDSTTECEIEYRHDKTDKDPHEQEYDGYDVQLKVDQQSCREQSITDDSINVTKVCDH